ncbi:MAG: energy transducer TonB [Campylobacterales bacterium]|nr:energy transducer TonB [Campylobacterales bacterium]
MSKLAWGMGLSVGVHVLVLGGLLLETPTQKPPVLHERPLVLSLQHIAALPVQETPPLAVEPPKESPPPPKQPPLVSPMPPKEKPKAKPKKPAPPVVKPAPKAPSEEVITANETPQEPVQEIPVGAEMPNTLLAASSQTTSAHAPVSLPVQGRAQAWEEEVYLQRLQAVILQHKSYPSRARKMKLQGEVIVTFEITPQGEVLNLNVVQSSNHAFLDQHTLKTIQEASTFFPKPPLRITVKVPVGYRLL